MARIAYIDCFAGIAGDMFLGALVEAGVPASVLNDAVAALDIGASLKIETVDRSGISALKVNVMEAGRLAEAARSQPHAHTHEHKHEHDEHAHSHDEHAHGEHSHEQGEDSQQRSEHTHAHGRSLKTIRGIIGKAKLEAGVAAMAIETFELLGRAEAKIHNVPVESIHFHEVGAVDAIADIVGASAGIHYLGVDAWFCSAVNVGGGMVQCAHGNFPVPAPATADLLRGFPTYSAHVAKELTTPTGAALLRALAPSFGPQPAMRVGAIGYGAGTRNPAGFPNVLRLSVGESEAGESDSGTAGGDVVTVLETAIDDLSPQVIAYAAEKALAAGALDAMLTPVVMKKGRPGTLLTVLCRPAESDALQSLLFRETSTLGIRVRQDRRCTLEREQVAVQTAYGAIRMKVASAGGEERNAAPEFADCRAAAERHGVALKEVQQAAVAAYRGDAASSDGAVGRGVSR